MEKINLSSIRFGIDAEIDEALTRYCRDELRLTKVYAQSLSSSFNEYFGIFDELTWNLCRAKYSKYRC